MNEMSDERPLQHLPWLSVNLEGSMLCLNPKNKRKKPSFGEGLHTENTPQELIQQWSPPHKLTRTSSKGKENETQFVLARRPRRKREFGGLSWDRLPDELLLGIFSNLSLQDLLGASRVCKRWHRLAFDESLWQSVDLVGKAQFDSALGQVLSVGVLALRCPRCSIGEPQLAHGRKFRVQHMDLSNCTVGTPVLEDILSRCQRLQGLSLEGLELSDNVLLSLAQNPELVRLNLGGCSGFSPESLRKMLCSCTRLEELNVSWCDFSEAHVEAVVCSIPPSVVQLNVSGYRQKLTPGDVSVLVERCPNLTHLDLSDSVLVADDSFPVLEQLRSLKHLALSRCYMILPDALSDFAKFSELRTLELFGLVQDSHLPLLGTMLPRLQINTRLFSGVARPTPAGARGRTMWGIRCRLFYRSESRR